MNRVIVICGDSGSGKTTLAKKLSKSLGHSIIVECDRYHKWERSDYHWKYYTHLNPLSNDIPSMCRDLRALQEGQVIFRSDYDHKTGTFTTPRELKPHRNIIVCGLHVASFDSPNSVKIFIDTEDDLKVLWKLNRDFMERGHRLKDILKKIEQRQIDYANHVFPQVHKCDIVVRVFYNCSSGLENQIFVHSKHNIPGEPSQTYEHFVLTEHKYDQVSALIQTILNT